MKIFCLTALIGQTVRFIFSNVAYRPTVYKTGVETHWEFLTLYGKDYLLHIIHTDNCIDHVKILSQAVAYGDQFLCVLALLPPSHHNYIQWCSCYYVVLPSIIRDFKNRWSQTVKNWCFNKESDIIISKLNSQIIA